MSFATECDNMLSRFYQTIDTAFAEEFAATFDIDSIDPQNRDQVFNWLKARINEPDRKVSCIKIGKMLRDDKGWPEASKWLREVGLSAQ